MIRKETELLVVPALPSLSCACGMLSSFLLLWGFGGQVGKGFLTLPATLFSLVLSEQGACLGGEGFEAVLYSI